MIWNKYFFFFFFTNLLVQKTVVGISSLSSKIWTLYTAVLPLLSSWLSTGSNSVGFKSLMKSFFLSHSPPKHIFHFSSCSVQRPVDAKRVLSDCLLSRPACKGRGLQHLFRVALQRAIIGLNVCGREGMRRGKWGRCPSQGLTNLWEKWKTTDQMALALCQTELSKC